MTTWTRAVGDGLCGRCGAAFVVGEPVEEHRFRGMLRALRRCVLCAHTTPPADAPAWTAPAPVTWTPRARVARPDVRVRQANDD